MKAYVSIILLAMLAGCATANPELVEFIREDAVAAQALAQDDRLALKCYVKIEADMVARPGEAVETKGVLSALQKARNLRRRVDKGISDEFYEACGPLYLQTRNRLLGLAARFLLPGS